MQLADGDRLILKEPTVEEAQAMLRDLTPDDLETRAQAELVLSKAGWPIEKIRSLISPAVIAADKQTISQ